MSPRSHEHYRRLQIGGIGLAAVILLVVLAGILSDRRLPGGVELQTDPVMTEETKTATTSEPLSELGVQPAPPAEDKREESNGASALPQQPRGATANTLPPALKPGERAPDLPSTAAPTQ